jgi:hypothetical protein
MSTTSKSCEGKAHKIYGFRASRVYLITNTLDAVCIIGSLVSGVEHRIVMLRIISRENMEKFYEMR